MKKFGGITFVLLLVAASSFAVEFAPTPMVISAPETVFYDFDGAEISIPIQITGTPANCQFLVFTKEQGAAISHVHNGYLGWHYVNAIDTCVYAGAPANYDIGSNNISWDGKDDDGNIVAAGEYSYYIWGYDNVTAFLEHVATGIVNEIELVYRRGEYYGVQTYDQSRRC